MTGRLLGREDRQIAADGAEKLLRYGDFLPYRLSVAA